MPKNNQIHNMLLKGGATIFGAKKTEKPEGYGHKILRKIKESKILSVLISILIILIIIFIIYAIWKAIYKKQTNEDDTCAHSKGCVLYSSVKSGDTAETIDSSRIPPSVSGSDYSFSLWLYVRSKNYDSGQKNRHNRDWKTIMYRENGRMTTDSDSSNLSVQPGVWLSSDTNKILIRWETVGRLKGIESCCKDEDCMKLSDIGRRCRMSDENDQDNVKRCVKKEGDEGVEWGGYTAKHSSMDPNLNPPSKHCNTMADTNDDNVDQFNNESCVDNIPLDRWFQLVIATHEHSADVYIDGKLVNTVTFDSPPRVNPYGNLVLSKDFSSAVNPIHGFSGAMTQVRYFSRALGPYEILKIYSWGPHPFQLSVPDEITGEWKGLGSFRDKGVTFTKGQRKYTRTPYYGFSGN